MPHTYTRWEFYPVYTLPNDLMPKRIKHEYHLNVLAKKRASQLPDASGSILDHFLFAHVPLNWLCVCSKVSLSSRWWSLCELRCAFLPLSLPIYYHINSCVYTRMHWKYLPSITVHVYICVYNIYKCKCPS